ncbi:S8 family serine peptidase [Psychrobacillus sp. BM2]|uniref:S8 family serine peptidase n=1 Tax=Psychrobacillus sp. BM2 TaxID=3400421 RepID=UPI003B02D37C
MLKLKRTLLITTAFMLSFSPAAFGMTGSGANIASKKNLPSLELQKPELNLPERLVNPEDPDEKVRIIVELEQAPTIEKATKKGVLYKQLKPSERESLEATVTDEQIDVQDSITDTAPSIEYLENFTTVFNGFSAEVEAKYVDEIADTAGVKAVYESTEYARPTEKPEMKYSKELVQAHEAWNDYGKTGEGMVVGIIDTGIDPSHKDMVLTNDSTGEITKSEVSALLADGSIKKGEYFTSKVPFGWNYMDGNNEILDIGPDASMHGMHVAGTVGANGDEENGGIKGVAPEAQLLALKVFGNDPGFASTYGDIYVKAIDDSLKLGVDVINMSLGSTAGYVDANNPEQQAVKRATENGVLVSISAGNSALFGDGYFYPYAENQDYGLTGSPSVSKESLGVASFENSTLTAYSYAYQIDGVEAGRALYLLANNADPLKKLSGKVGVIDAGLGKPEDFAGKDFKGKIALIKRGDIGFVDKGINAQAAGAAGVIIYNNAAGTINMASDPGITIPYMFSLKADGDALKAALSGGKSVTVQYDGQFTNTANPTAGLMSDFSSWGPTPNLDFKPEITAPGGNIFSTLNNDKYGLMSGTSMAAPHVSGGAALILERVDGDFGVTGSDRVQLAKNLLMNTAKPVVFAEYRDGTNEYVSPRRQGSGLMQLANALETDVVVTETTTGEAKVALKEIKDNKFTFTLKAKNFSNEEKTYNVNTQVQMDAPAPAGGGLYVNDPNNDGQFVLIEGEEVEITAPESVTIPGNGTTDISISVDVTFMAELFESVYTNGFFVDGFVTLTDTEEDATGNVPLTVPFFGFNGEWDDAPIFDYFAWDPMYYWGYTALADEQGMFIDGGGNFDTSRFGFSPNGDGVRDKAIPAFSLFRNAKEFKVEVLDSDRNKLRTIKTSKNLTKHYISTNPYTYNTSYGWDGKINNKAAADGDYIIQLSGVIDFEGAEWQSIQFPVKVDTVAPTADVEFDPETKTVTIANLSDTEGGTGADYWQVLVNGKIVTDELSVLDSEIVVDSITNKDSNITVKVWDAAGNFKNYSFDLESEEETENPVIFIDTPEFFDAFDTNEILVSGHVDDASKILSVTVNGEEAEFDGINFTYTLTLDDGVKDVIVATEDEFHNSMQITRKIFVDTQVPSVQVKNNYPKNTKSETVKVNVTVADNFDEISLYVNGDERFAQALSEPYKMDGFSKEIEVDLALVNGNNEFTFEVEDLVGHKTTETITINKSDVVVEEPGNGGGTPTTPSTPSTPSAPSTPSTPTPPTTTPAVPGNVVVDDKKVDEQVKDTKTTRVEVTVPAPTADKPKVNAEVSATALKAIADSGKSFVMKAGETGLTVPSEVLKEISKNGNGKTNFKINLDKDAKVPGNGTTVSSVYDFEITVEKDGKTSTVSTFSKPIEVSVPVNASAVKNADKVAAYYVNEKTNALEYVGSKYANGKVTFKTNHFSKFVVVENNKTFKDIEKSWAIDYIESLASKTIINGKTEDTFAPNDQITRAQFALLLTRSLNLPKEEYQGTFSDVTEEMTWSVYEIEAANRAGIIVGSAGKFNPNEKITRQQMATMIVRAIKYNDDSALKEANGKVKFADEASIGDYAKENVALAAELGIISGKEVNGKQVFAPLENATRAQASKMLYHLLGTF